MKRPLQDYAMFFSTPGMEKSSFCCADHRVLSNIFSNPFRVENPKITLLEISMCCISW